MIHNHNNVTALIALGANIGTGDTDLKATLAAAVDEIAKVATVLTQSRTYRTPCFPAGIGPDYLNAAVEVRWDGESSALLNHLHAVEHRFGRERTTRWAARSLDLDLIAHGDRVAPDRATFLQWETLPLADQINMAPDQLILPHPRIQDRAFVLGPLLDIAPEWVHPVFGLTAQQMWDALPAADRTAIQPV